MSGTGDIIGSSANYWDPSYGGVPNVPDPISSAYQSTIGNIGNLGSIYNLAGGINTFGAQQAAGQYQANLPGYADMTKTASADILQNLEGQVPADVISNLQQGAAERGIATGAPGSSNAGAQYLKALGLTSLGQENLGQTQLTSAIQRTPTSPLFNVASELVSPTDEQAARTAANMYAAAPNPAVAAQTAMDNAAAGLKAGAGGAGGGGLSLAGAAPSGTVFPTSPDSAVPTYPNPPVLGGTAGGGGPGSTPNWYTGYPSTTTGTGSLGDVYGLGNDGTTPYYDPETGLMIDPSGGDAGDGSTPYYDPETGLMIDPSDPEYVGG
jgi:hypothetical protein